MFDTSTRTIAATIGRLALAAMFSAACLGAAVLPASAAPADDDTTMQTHEVSTKDLNLTLPRDQAVLMRRLQVAARRVCKDPTSAGLESTPGYEECVQSAMYFARAHANAAIASAAKAPVVASAEK